MGARRHPTDDDLLNLAVGAAGATDAEVDATRRHAAACARCGALLSTYSLLVQGIRDEESFLREVESAGEGSAHACLAARRTVRLAAAAEGLVERLLEGAADGPEELREALDAAANDEKAFPLALLYACQKGARLAAQAPRRAEALAHAAYRAARSLPRQAGEALVSRPALRGEALLLFSQSALIRERATAARRLAKAARKHLNGGAEERAFDLARCDYFEGSAASFDHDLEGATDLLRSAERRFAEARQEGWVGRAQAALASTAIAAESYAEAARLARDAAHHLTSAEDGQAWVGLRTNEGLALKYLGRLDDATAAYRDALEGAMRLGLAPYALAIQLNLAAVGVETGDHASALAALRRLSVPLERSDMPDRLLLLRLLVAECLGALGRIAEMAAEIDALRRLPRPGGPVEAAFADLFGGLDRGILGHRHVRHVREFFEHVLFGQPAEYVRFDAA